jgi:hypothetical protein
LNKKLRKLVALFVVPAIFVLNGPIIQTVYAAAATTTNIANTGIAKSVSGKHILVSQVNATAGAVSEGATAASSTATAATTGTTTTATTGISTAATATTTAVTATTAAVTGISTLAVVGVGTVVAGGAALALGGGGGSSSSSSYDYCSGSDTTVANGGTATITCNGDSQSVCTNGGSNTINIKFSSISDPSCYFLLQTTTGGTISLSSISFLYGSTLSSTNVTLAADGDTHALTQITCTSWPDTSNSCGGGTSSSSSFTGYGGGSGSDGSGSTLTDTEIAPVTDTEIAPAPVTSPVTAPVSYGRGGSSAGGSISFSRAAPEESTVDSDYGGGVVIIPDVTFSTGTITFITDPTD